MDMEKLVDEYLSRFEQGLPYALTNSLTDEELAALIKKSLETGQPIGFAEDPGKIY